MTGFKLVLIFVVAWPCYAELNPTHHPTWPGVGGTSPSSGRRCNFSALIIDDEPVTIEKVASTKAAAFPELKRLFNRYHFSKEFHSLNIAADILDQSGYASQEVKGHIIAKQKEFAANLETLDLAIYRIIELLPFNDEAPPVLEELIKIQSVLAMNHIPNETKVQWMNLLEGAMAKGNDSDLLDDQNLANVVYSSDFELLKEGLFKWQANGSLSGEPLYIFEADNWTL